MDPNYFVLLGLGLHLEHTEMLRNENNSPLLFGITKCRIRILFKKITSQDNFQLTSPNPIGNYSIRKLPATYARRNGCSKDDVDARRRWKSNKKDCGYLYRLTNISPWCKSCIHIMYWRACQIRGGRRA